ncbi:imidazolonepropionase [Chloroflexota bacterium]
MKQSVDLLVVNAGQLCTVPRQVGGPQRGHAIGDLGIVENGALAITAGVVTAVGPAEVITAAYDSDQIIDAQDCLVTPGLVDPHTHFVWAGDRAVEFERRIAGASYQEIMAEGGGIAYTTRATRAASLDELVTIGLQRLDIALRHGTTTVEIKTGYGLDTVTEIKMLKAIALLDAEHPVRVVPTFLGAHAIPPEFADDSDAYVDLILNEMLPAVVAWKKEQWPGDLFCDVFCEQGAFTLAQTRRVLEAALAASLKLKIHVDEFKALGGTRLGIELGAVSLDHLDVTPDDELALFGSSSTVAVPLPTTPFGLGNAHYPPVQKMLDADAIVALATDCNPGPAWTENMQFVMALATRYHALTQGQALVASTLNAAYALDIGDRVGSLESGSAADLVIWQAHDYRELGYHFGVNLVDRVIVGGQMI